MELVTNLFAFLKVLLLFMAIMNIVKDGFRLYKSIKRKTEYNISKPGIFLFGLSLSYVLTLILI